MSRVGLLVLREGEQSYAVVFDLSERGALGDVLDDLGGVDDLAAADDVDAVVEKKRCHGRGRAGEYHKAVFTQFQEILGRVVDKT